MPLHALLRTHLRYIRPRRRLGWEVSELVPVHRRVEPAFRGTERDDAHRGTQEVRHTRLRQGRDGNLRAGVRAELQENREPFQDGRTDGHTHARTHAKIPPNPSKSSPNQEEWSVGSFARSVGSVGRLSFR